MRNHGTGSDRVGRLKNRIRDNRGFTIGEVMVTLIILMLVTSLVARGVQLAAEHYTRSLATSESKILYSTLSNIISGELSNVKDIRSASQDASQYNLGAANGGTAGYVLCDHYGDNYSRFFVIDPESVTSDQLITSDYGELLIGTDDGGTLNGDFLVGSKAYSSHDLRAKVNVVYSRTDNVFHVTLKIKRKQGSKDLVSGSFDVIPLNTIEIKPLTDG